MNKTLKLVIIGLSVIVALCLISGCNGNTSQEAIPTKSAEQTAQEQAEREKKQKETVEELTSLFCENRQGEYSYGIYFCGSCVDLGDIITLFESDGTVTIHNAKSPPTEETCKKVADYCLKRWGEYSCRRIAEKKIWMGMTETQLLISWGVSEENNTVGSWGTHSQRVYGNFGPYVYLEGKNKNSLVVTSWQD